MRKLKILTTFILTIMLALSLTACKGGEGNKGNNPTTPAEVWSEVVDDADIVYNKFSSAYRDSSVFDIYDYYENPVHFSYDMEYKTVFTDLISKGSLGCEQTMDWTGESVVYADDKENLQLLYKEAILTNDWGFDVYGSEQKQEVASKKYSYYKDKYVYNSIDDKTASKSYDGGSVKNSIIMNRPGGNLTSRVFNLIEVNYNKAIKAHGNVKIYLNEDGNAMKFVITKAVSFEDIRDYTIIDGYKYVSTYRLEQRKNAYTWTIINNYEMSVILSFNENELGEFTSLNYVDLNVSTIEDNEQSANKDKVFSSVKISERVKMLDGIEMEFPKYILDM